MRFRVKAEPRDILEALRPMYGSGHLEVRGLGLVPLERGILGFQQASAIVIDDMVLGRMDYGGTSQRDWVRVDIPGKGCEWVKDWDTSELEQLPDAELRRLDVALTTWDGEVTHDQVVKAHQEGRFITRGRPPVLTQITSSNPRAGKTCYIGKREKSDKFMRCYEKGYEMAAAMASRCPGEISNIDSKAIEDIYRCEVEFKASATDITWDAIARRDQYFAGAYPFCADVLPGVECDILMRRPEREPQTELAAALENCRVQFGPTLYTALMAYHGDMTAVWDKIIGDHHNQTLTKAGALLVEHE
jgi:DNA relaxase NicK